MNHIAEKIHARKSTLEPRAKIIMLKLENDFEPHRASITSEVQGIISSKESLVQKLKHMHEVESKMRSLTASSTACARGCANCCYERTDMSATEAKIIGERTGITPAEISANYTSPNVYAYGRNTPCPFLVDNECSIYEHRPFMCRSIANFDVDALLCSFENHELSRDGDPRSTPVPLLPSFLNQVYAWLIRDDVVADIRDFFPRMPNPATTTNGLKS